nr:MAG TPA: hypothetical protein [Caudoviricetes sp.]DAP09885.1 MAG TPA: hypothetical protein [Caudoviricetes sp.]
MTARESRLNRPRAASSVHSFVLCLVESPPYCSVMLNAMPT